MPENNKDLIAARVKKNSEFYTQRTDIEKELKYYKKFFKGKIVYCNCDDPRVSQFFHYFSDNFDHLGLKKLITTCYKNQDENLFSRGKSEKAIYLEFNGIKKNNKNEKKIDIKKLNGDGDFRSKECLNLLEQSDIVVTNPPFSLFGDLIDLLIRYKKKFLLLGDINKTSKKNIVVLMRKKKIWIGASIHSGDRWFGVPDEYPLDAATTKTEKGKKFLKVKGVRWFTNLNYRERPTHLELYKKYRGNEKEYPKFKYYNAINIDEARKIPKDYSGAMAVPITFLDKHDPNQFEIISCNDIKINKNIKDKEHGLIKDKESLLVGKNGRKTYVRYVIKNKKVER